ncbi:MAG: hypothetical protein JEZ14_15300 [Marinilabiliaceae bacterium]|nr:hypothetical protein [Marinilabiliaceae bacterium]
MNYMQHGQDRKNDLTVLIDKKKVLNEAEKRNYNGDIYKALLNMNYRLKNGFQSNQDLTPFIIEYARFVSAPYGKLPDSLKKDRFMRFGQIINKKLSNDKKLDIDKLFRVEQQSQLNGKVYRALGEFNKLLTNKECIGDVNDTIIALSKGSQIYTTEKHDLYYQSQSTPIADTVSSLIKDLSLGSIKESNSGSTYREEARPKKRKKNNNRPKL